MTQSEEIISKVCGTLHKICHIEALKLNGANICEDCKEKLKTAFSDWVAKEYDREFGII